MRRAGWLAAVVSTPLVLSALVAAPVAGAATAPTIRVAAVTGVEWAIPGLGVLAPAADAGMPVGKHVERRNSCDPAMMDP